MLCFSIKLSPWFQIVVVNQMVLIVTYKELNGLPRILKILRTRWGKIRSIGMVLFQQGLLKMAKV